MDINTLVVYKELDEAIKFIESLKPGVYEFSDRYIVLKELSLTNGKIYKRGDEVLLKPSFVRKLGEGRVQLKKSDNSKQDSIRKIKQYLDFRIGTCLKDVTFSECFSKFKVY